MTESHFEVSVEKQGQWTIQLQTPQKNEALQLAQQMLSQGKVAGVKVTYEQRIGNSERTTSKVVFEGQSETYAAARRTPADQKLSGTLDNAPLCDITEDLVMWPSRQIMNRLFRGYLDKFGITPTEVMHDYDHWKDLENSSSLINMAIGAVAQAQSKATGGQVAERREHLTELKDALRAQLKAIGTDKARFRTIEPTELFDYAGFLAQQPDLDDPQQQAYLCTAIARTIRSSAGWGGKVDRLLSLLPMEGTPSPNVIAVLDSFLSDILSSPYALEELLGGQATLGSAIMTITMLQAGALQPNRHTPEVLIQLSALFANTTLENCQNILSTWIARKLSSNSNLTKDETNKEIEMLQKIVRSQSKTSRSNREVVQAVKARSVSQLPAEISRQFKLVRDPLDRLKRLTSLKSSAFGEESLNILVQHIHTILSTNQEGIERALEPLGNSVQRLRAMKEIHDQIANFKTKNPQKSECLDHIHTICLKLLRDGQIIQKIELQHAHLPNKIYKLLVLATSNILPEGQCMNLLRQRILSFMQVPDFKATYTETASTAAEASKSLADLKKMLQSAGISYDL